MKVKLLDVTYDPGNTKAKILAQLCHNMKALSLLTMFYHLRRNFMEVQLSINLVVLYQCHKPNYEFLICIYCHIPTVIYNSQSISNVVLKTIWLYRN